MIRPALVLLLSFTGLTGLAYPLTLTLLGDDALPTGVLALRAFDGPDEFWGRPQSGSPTASSGSNLGPTNPAFMKLVAERVERLRRAHPAQTGPVPADLVTASGSGLDPDVSPAGARFQVERVAAARGLDPAAVRALVDAQTEPRLVGLFGEPRVNVTRLNLALDRLAPRRAAKEAW